MSLHRHQLCPQCGSDALAEIVYGYPGPELLDLVEQGKVILGGCVRVTSEEISDTPQACRHCDWYSGMPDPRESQ